MERIILIENDANGLLFRLEEEIKRFQEVFKNNLKNLKKNIFLLKTMLYF